MSKPRGLAAMDPDMQREIASKGGIRAHQKGTAHRFTSDEARTAGRKGGNIISQRPGHMADIGKRGGRSRSEKKYHQKRAEQKNG